jgi:hypothetical protein
VKADEGQFLRPIIYIMYHIDHSSALTPRFRLGGSRFYALTRLTVTVTVRGLLAHTGQIIRSQRSARY